MVEDNAGDRWYYSELLRARGYEVVSREDGEGAWEAFQEDPPPLVILDLMLPGIDGGELCRRIRRHARGREPVVVAVTAAEEPDLIARILGAGADDFLQKPVPPKLFNVRMEIAESRINDRAERRDTRTRLAAVTRELAKLFRNLPGVFFSFDIPGRRLIQISPGAEVLFGRSVAEFLSDDTLWPRYLLPEEGDEDPWELLEGVSPGETFVREYPVTRREGDTWVRATISVDVDPATGLLRADGFVIDVHREHEAQEAIEERNRHLASLYRASELTLTSSSPEAYPEILEVVAQALEVPTVLLERFDRERDLLVTVAAHGVGNPSSDPAGIPAHLTPSGTALRTERPHLVTDPARLNGTRHPSLGPAAPMAWAAFPLVTGGVTGTLTLVDVKARRWDRPWIDLGTSLAAILSTHIERLEAEAAVRASETHHRALARELKEANQELESFAYSISHDLRAPLRTMQGFAHLVLQRHGGSLPPDAQDYLGRIVASGRRSERLITDLLAYSRLSYERLDVRPVELDSVLDQALEQLHGDIEAAGASIERPDTLPAVEGNPTALVQVLANLLSNAIKFVPDGRRPEVRIHHEALRGRVRLWIEDNGIGIPPGQEDRIFGVFERLTEGDERPGTGIGLAIVRRGMQRIGGRCGVARVGEGSAFWIEARSVGAPVPQDTARRSRS